jgi:3-hydroxyisobutyrate dehydrogenase-like beta-hydroxyacid dehydrogenase
MRIGYLGVGMMGQPMAEKLVNAGHEPDRFRYPTPRRWRRAASLRSPVAPTAA